jgi:hypothetical protein
VHSSDLVQAVEVRRSMSSQERRVSINGSQADVIAEYEPPILLLHALFRWETVITFGALAVGFDAG